MALALFALAVAMVACKLRQHSALPSWMGGERAGRPGTVWVNPHDRRLDGRTPGDAAPIPRGRRLRQAAVRGRRGARRALPYLLHSAPPNMARRCRWSPTPISTLRRTPTRASRSTSSSNSKHPRRRASHAAAPQRPPVFAGHGHPRCVAGPRRAAGHLPERGDAGCGRSVAVLHAGYAHRARVPVDHAGGEPTRCHAPVCAGFDPVVTSKRHVIALAPHIDDKLILHHISLLQVGYGGFPHRPSVRWEARLRGASSSGGRREARASSSHRRPVSPRIRRRTGWCKSTT